MENISISDQLSLPVVCEADVVIAGAGTRLEIWDKAVREQYNAACQTPEEMAASMSGIGFLI